jgi:hypothetical protein
MVVSNIEIVHGYLFLVNLKSKLKKKGYKWGINSKFFVQIMKMYGGQHMCDFFQLNFVGLNYKALKRVNKKVHNLYLVNMLFSDV